MASGVSIPVKLIDNISSGVDHIKNKLDVFGKASTQVKFGMGAGVGIAAFNMLSGAIGGATDAIFDSVDAASDLNENMSKMRAVFGANSAEIERFASRGPEALQMTKSAALGALGTLGALFSALKIAGDESVRMSEGIVGLSVDLASFYNMDPGEALERLRSGLVGESEAVRILGVDISEAAVKTKAMEMGLGSLTGVLSTSEKVQARYALIMEQTVIAQGDAAKTGGALAGQQRILSAQMGDLSTEIGSALLPIMLKLVGAARSMVDGVRTLGAIVGQNEGIFKLLAAALAGVLARMVAIKALGIVVLFKDIAVAALGTAGAVGTLGRAALAAQGAFALIGVAVMLLMENFDQVMQGLRVLAYHLVGFVGTLLDVASALPGASEALAGLRQIVADVRAGLVADMAAAQAALAETPTVAEDAAAGVAVALDGMAEDTKTSGKAMVKATRTTLADLLEAVKKLKKDLVAAWKDALTERNRSADIADELIINKAEQAAQRKIIIDKNSTAAEKAEARIRLRALKADYTTLLIEQTTYGTAAEQIARSKALLTSKALLDGLRDKNPQIAAQWREVQRITEEHLLQLQLGAGAAGRGVADALSEGMAGKRALKQVGDAATTVMGKVIAIIAGRSARTDYYEAGVDLTESFARGIRARKALGAITDAVNAVIRTILRMLGISFTGTGGSSGGSTGHYASGTSYVPRDQLAFLHRGEAVIPANRNLAGGGVIVNVPIQSFYGTQDNITELSRAIGQQVRLATVKGTG